jgi:4-amino-4-deoxy-L-arabinose transferase-like glycosyltransferase
MEFIPRYVNRTRAANGVRLRGIVVGPRAPGAFNSVLLLTGDATTGRRATQGEGDGYGSPIGENGTLGSDRHEAYYDLYARHLDWGYFDHPPMVGLVAFLGLKAAAWITPIFGLRLGFILLFAASSVLMARITARAFGPWAGFFAALALNTTVFYGLMVGAMAGPDGPLLFFWLLTLDRLIVALAEPECAASWLWVGAAWGGALLCKYYAVLIPTGLVLQILIRPESRRLLRLPGPYLAVATGMSVFSPVVLWNATHGWMSFAFQGGRASGFHGIQPVFFLEALVAQFLLLTPWTFLLLIAVAVRLLSRGRRSWTNSEAFFLTQATPALGLFLGLSTFQRIMPHWPMVGFLPLIPLLGRFWERQATERPRRTRLELATITAIPALLATLLVIHARTGLLSDGRGRMLGLIPAAADPTIDTIRWDQIARELRRRKSLDRPGTYLFTDQWRLSAELAMATGEASQVACFNRDARSFRCWSRPKDWLGRDGLFVRVGDGLVPPTFYAPWFRRIEPLAPIVIVRAGLPVETVRIYRCVHQLSPFPFDYNGPGPMPMPPSVLKTTTASKPDPSPAK